MKLLIIIRNNPFVSSSASANRWLTLIEGLVGLDMQTKLIIYGGYLSINEKNVWGDSGLRDGIEYKYISSITLQGYWKQRFHNYFYNFTQTRPVIKKILIEINNTEGIVWTDVNLLGFQLAVSIKKRKLERVHLFLEMSEFLDIHKYNKGNRLQRWQADRTQKYFEKKAVHAYDGLALMTKTLLNHYEQFQKPIPKLLHLPMTVDLERFSCEIKVLPGFEKPYIAFVGVMNDAKDGVSILIKAFTKISNEFPALKLYLIGGWNYDTPIHAQLIKEFKMQDKIFWRGEFNRDQIPAIIKNATILALPRPDSKQAQGGFPTKLGEYLATGNPVCATKVGEIPEYLIDGESIYFAEPGSVDSFAEALQRALSNRVEANRIGTNGCKVAEQKFNKDIQSKKLYDFFSRLLSKDITINLFSILIFSLFFVICVQ